MPITRAGDFSPGITLESGTGEITAHELLAALTKHRHAGSIKVLSDYQAASLTATATDLRMLAEALDANSAKFELAWAVAAPDAATFGQLRMLEVYLHRSPVKLGVFRSLGEAQAWLEGPKGMVAGGSA
ncbi:MAG: hypothetical protein HS116_12210 [Planctomycetes bacterium]|nr:hypothetical protein [Planctomycetota bacterium]